MSARRVNKAVDMLAQGQPIYYTGAEDRSYEGGRAAAKTWADYVTFEMEHGAYDVSRLHEFMRGLVDGGPTESGHRTPGRDRHAADQRADEQASAPMSGWLARYWRGIPRHFAVPRRVAGGREGICRCDALSVCRPRWLRGPAVVSVGQATAAADLGTR